MITDRRKFTTGMSSFHFLPLESILSLIPGLYVPHKKGRPTYSNFRQRLMSDIAYQNQ